jgi:hypothetical protein
MQSLPSMLGRTAKLLIENFDGGGWNRVLLTRRVAHPTQ